MSDWQTIKLGTKKYKVRIRPGYQTPWEGVEAYCWLDGWGWDMTREVRRSETLKRLYEAAVDETVAQRIRRECKALFA